MTTCAYLLLFALAGLSACCVIYRSTGDCDLGTAGASIAIQPAAQASPAITGHH